MTLARVITWQAPNGAKINITPKAEVLMKEKGFWPKNSIGEEYCSVSRGLHLADVDISAADVPDLIKKARN